MPFLSVSNNVNIVMLTKYHLRSSRKLLTKLIYFEKSNSLKINKNKPIMFVRAPKHFKRGKQIIFWFEGMYRKRFNLNFKHHLSWVLFDKHQTFVNILNSELPQLKRPDLTVSRITLNAKCLLKYN